MENYLVPGTEDSQILKMWIEGEEDNTLESHINLGAVQVVKTWRDTHQHHAEKISQLLYNSCPFFPPNVESMPCWYVLISELIRYFKKWHIVAGEKADILCWRDIMCNVSNMLNLFGPESFQEENNEDE